MKTKATFKDMENLGGGYWRYDILDFYYLKNHYFPTTEMYDILKKELPILCDNYPSSQKVIAKSLSKWKDEDYFNEDNLIVGNGSSELIGLLINTMNKYANPKTTIPIPTYNDYLKIQNRKLFYPCEENKYKIDVDELIEVIENSGSNFVVLVNPNNPVSSIVTRAEIKKILETGTLVIVDESFIDFTKENSVQDLVQKYRKLIVITSCTKTMGLSGLRLGYLLTTNRFIKGEIRELLPRWNVNSLSERFIELFPEFKDDYWESIKKTIDDRNYLFKELKKINYLEPFESHANFILCKTKISAKTIAEHLYYKHKILVRPGLIQKNLLEDKYLRIGVNTKKDNDKLILALKEMEGYNE